MTSVSRRRSLEPAHKCDTCGSRSCCVVDGLSSEQLLGLRNITLTRGPYQTGEPIFRLGERFRSLYVVQSGTVKIETVSSEGFHLVDGFFFRGDLVGLEAIGGERYQHNAVALEETWVCELQFDHLESLCSFIPRLQHRILILLGRKLNHMNETFLHGRYLSAEKRLLLFLQLLCHKNVIRKNGLIPSLELPMSKGDIASYLGLRAESLSRSLSKLQSEGVLFNRGRTIDLLDIDAVLKCACS